MDSIILLVEPSARNDDTNGELYLHDGSGDVGDLPHMA